MQSKLKFELTFIPQFLTNILCAGTFDESHVCRCENRRLNFFKFSELRHSQLGIALYLVAGYCTR